MTITATRAFNRPNRQRWLLEFDGQAGQQVVFTTTDALTGLDLLHGALAGQIRQIALAVVQGFGSFAAGAQTQAKARALWLSDRSGADPGVLLMTARCKVTPRTGTVAPVWDVDAGVDGGGNPIVTVSTPLVTAASVYFDVELEGGAIGA